ncbi:hypothetical protein FVQ98_19190 [Ottowia sp. GY511]|uniref:Uncharacterized protein n=1 Tax=Ottowia flava TaxID=2675430 RepID=A0ABW4KXX2_9BURK|nr:hypothetical protein FVQ98_19190 [Ottowia sp. GY511]
MGKKQAPEGADKLFKGANLPQSGYVKSLRWPFTGQTGIINSMQTLSDPFLRARAHGTSAAQVGAGLRAWTHFTTAGAWMPQGARLAAALR